MRASPGDIAILRQTIDALREAFLKFANVVRMDDAPRIAGIALIDDYRHRWEDWPWPSLPDGNDFICTQNLARVSGIVTNALGANSGVVVEWFALGSLLAEGDWHGFPYETSSKWQWKWPDRIQRCLNATQLGFAQVFPRVKDEEYLIGGGYGINQYAAWKCLDVGLANLERLSSTIPAETAEIDTLERNRHAIVGKRQYIGKSLPILRMFERIAQLNKTADAPILLIGPTGVGKTEVADLIHMHMLKLRSGAKAGEGTPSEVNRSDVGAHDGKLCRFVRVSATALLNSNEAIVSQEWAGYGKNSTVEHAIPEGIPGLIEECSGGTIFLDEAHLLPKWFQTFLLDVLDRKPIPRAHAGTPDNQVQPDVRMIFASNWKLDDLQSTLNPDLFRRLREWVVSIPTLDERKEDILQFVREWCKGHKWDYRFLLALFHGSWPGNVGQLKSVLNKALAQAGPGKKLTVDHLSLGDHSVVPAIKRLTNGDSEQKTLRLLVEIFNRQGYEKRKGLQKRIAAILGTSESAISKKLTKLRR